MSDLFVITGPPGSGKTPILRLLAELHFACAEEFARAVIAEQRASGGGAIYERDPRLFLDLMLDRAIADHRSAASSDGPVFFDRAIPDLIGYAGLFGLDASGAANAAAAHRYNETVFVLPSWPEIYTTDGDRRMSFEAAAEFGERVEAIYTDLGYTLATVPRDTVEARVAFILDALGLGSDMGRSFA